MSLRCDDGQLGVVIYVAEVVRMAYNTVLYVVEVLLYVVELVMMANYTAVKLGRKFPVKYHRIFQITV
eukprot:682627-Amorphochlora_amoeboformis.AAC.2